VAVGTLTEHQLAELAAAEISRGARTGRAARTAAVSAADVLASAPVNGVLRELMLPAESTGAIAVVLGSLARSRRAARVRALLTGWGLATADTTSAAGWLYDPGAAARRAAGEAYARAGVLDPAADIDVVELTAGSPALIEPLREALGLAKGPAHDLVNPSGGVRSNYPGIANGALRMLEAVRWLEDNGGRAVAHSTELLTGPVAETTTVFLVEAV
jgi:hypothetical protein